MAKVEGYNFANPEKRDLMLSLEDVRKNIKDLEKNLQTAKRNIGSGYTEDDTKEIEWKISGLKLKEQTLKLKIFEIDPVENTEEEK